uniref:Uncharacterized protein n=1 Tax=Anguilla anguilla TaxID=7936 RepID=A0A0E9WSB0_ANGAN
MGYSGSVKPVGSSAVCLDWSIYFGVEPLDHGAALRLEQLFKTMNIIIEFKEQLFRS